MSDGVEPIKHKGGKNFLLWLVLLIVLLAGVLYLIIGQSKIKQVVVSGSHHYDREDIIKMVGIDETTTVLDVYMKRNRDIANLPYIKNVAIDYLSFNAIQIKVEEKEIVSYIPYQNQFLALDKEGYIVGYEQEKIIDLPSVEGLYFSSASLGQKLEVGPEVLRALLDFYHLRNKYDVKLTDIVFVEGDATMIYGYSGNIKIIFGATNELDRKMKDAGEVLKSLDPSISGTLDLQIDSDRYIFKELINSLAYVAYEDRYLAVDAQLIVKKIARNPMLDQPLVLGLELEPPVVSQPLAMDESLLPLVGELISLVNQTPIRINQVLLNNGDGTDIRLKSGEITLLIGDLTRFDSKMTAAKKVIDALESPLEGSIDLREEKETYVFEEKVQ